MAPVKLTMDMERSFSSSEIRPNMSDRGSPLDDIGQTLERLAVSRPDAPAIHAPGRTSLSYADLGEQLRYVRARLANWDIGRGDIIAGVIPGRPELAVACATIPGAATFAPLNPALGGDVYAELLTRLKPKALITPRGLEHVIRPIANRCGVTELELVPDLSAPAGMFTFELGISGRFLRTPRLTPTDTAYIIATTGTTGRRKLIPLTHRRTLLSSHAQASRLGYSASDVGCHLLPMHLTHGLRIGLMSPLLSGVAVGCLPEADVTAFFKAIDQLQPTCFWGGFTLLREILRQAPAHESVIARSRFRFIRAGSGRLDPAEIDRLEQTFGAPVLVALASSESDQVAHQPLPPELRKRGSIGVPLAGYNEVAILDPAGGFFSSGETGEIVVRGPLVFGGYFDDPSLTAASFRDDWFRTGDLGKFDDDGHFYLAGRIKDIINRGGEKISPAEIDEAIESSPGIQGAATFGIPHPTLGEEIVAAVVKSGSAVVEEADIIEQVRRRMGPKRVPRKIYFVDQLPRTESGKIRRSELPRLLGLDQQDAPSPNESVLAAPAPTSPLEAALLGLWSSVLQVKSMGVNDDFSLLGGDPLRGARLLTSIKAIFGVDLPIDLLFSNPATVAGMARAIEATRSANASVDHG